MIFVISIVQALCQQAMECGLSAQQLDITLIKQYDHIPCLYLDPIGAIIYDQIDDISLI
jgi:hypothetical protein